ncbi:hypothetical protein ACLKA6_004572 [Drosophila palustris]
MLITNHPSDVGRGGAVIIIRSNLIHHPLSFTSQANAQAVAISLGNNSELTIAAIYLKPGGWQDTIDDAQLLDIFLGLGPRFIIGGDFNARHGFWGCQKSCKRGRAIANLSQSQNWNILATGAPTYFPYGRRGSPSNLDFAIYKGIPDRNLFMESRLDLSSDHLPLIAFLQHDVVYLRNRVSLLPKKTNMLLFQRKLERILDADRSFQSPGDIDDGIDHLNQCIEVISADFQNRDPVSINPLSRIFPLSGEALALLEEKRRVRRRWLRNGNFEDNRAWKLLSRRLRSVLTEDKRRHFETLLEGMDPRKPSDFNVWNLTKGIKRQAPSNFAIQTDQGWSKSDSEKASIFGLLLFKAFLTPIWTYGVAIWGIAADSHIHSLQFKLNWILRNMVAEEDITEEIECPELPELDGYVSDASTITRDVSALCTTADQEVILDVASDDEDANQTVVDVISSDVP